MPKTHEHWMQRSFQLAAQGLGPAAPNPLVGCVIVHQDRIIGEGYHTRAGQAHAEVEALRSVTEPRLLAESTMYVNLEPCAHQGRTPACAPQVVQAGIPTVVIANRDPFDQVDGKGIAILKAAGIEVVTGVLEKEGQWLNRRFFTQVTKGRPYVILKWAQSPDGFMAPEDDPTGAVHWITAPETQAITHRWRAEESAILVGAGTVLKDNPALTVRAAAGEHPLRVVLDDQLQTPVDAEVYKPTGDHLLVHAPGLSASDRNGWALERSKDFLSHLLTALHHKGVQSLIVEGGRNVLNTFIEAGLWDEARIWTGARALHGGTPAPTLHSREISQTVYGVDTLSVRLPL